MTKNKPISLNNLSSANREKTAAATVKVFDAIQNEKSEIQVMSLVAAIWVILRTSDLNILDALGFIGNMARDRKHSQRIHPTFAGLIQYAKKHINH